MKQLTPKRIERMWVNWQIRILMGSIFTVVYAPSVAAQITPDATLPVGERSQVTGNSNVQIEGGARRGGNLFHSFDQFSVPTGGSAYFNNAADVQNIFSRVTGRSVSNIDGVIRANGRANLFLLNPNGILFGPNARLNIGGSFIATTADSINFADNFQYSATNPQTAPLLTVSVPVGLQMGANPGRIALQGNGYDLSVAVPTFAPIVRGGRTAGLQVPAGQALALLGGDINIQGGVLTAEQGRIELGSARDGIVNLGERFVLSYPGMQQFGDIHLSQQALADASGAPGGSIAVQGNRVSLADGSLLLIQNQGVQQGGNIRVQATSSLNVNGESPTQNILSGLHSETTGSGSGASIAVFTPMLVVQEGGEIVTYSFGSGRGGNMTVSAPNKVQISGVSSSGISNSRIISFTLGSGTGGDITLSTRRLIIDSGATISTITPIGTGRGGDLVVDAADSIDIIGANITGASSDTISSLSASSGTGDAGNLIVNTRRLTLSEGGAIFTSTFSTGNAGSLTINALESVDVTGRAQLTIPVSSQISSSGFLFPFPGRTLTGGAGDVTITTARLSVTDGATIDVSNQGAGDAGTLRLVANSVVLDRQGAITAATASGQGGNITLNVRDALLLRNDSPITAAAGGNGNGGTIDITAGSLTLLGNTQLSTTASGVGNAGDITVSADAVRLSGGAQLRTSTSGRGQAGNITLNTPILQLSGRTSGLFAGTTSTGDAGNLTIQPRGNGQAVRVDLDAGAQISASTSSSGRGGQLTITAPDSITLTGNGSIISAETSGRGIGGNLTLQTGDLNIQNQAEVTVSSSGRGSAGSLFVDADRIFLDNEGSIRADTSGGGGNISLRSPLILLQNGSNITTNATGRNIPGGNIDIDTQFLVAVPNENSNISANSENFRGGNVSINAIALYGIQPSLVSTPLSDITATGATSALLGTIDVTTTGIDPTAGLVALPADLVDASQLIAQGCPADAGSSFVITGRGGLPPTPAQELDDAPEWDDRSILTVTQQRGQGDTETWRRGDEGERSSRGQGEANPSPIFHFPAQNSTLAHPLHPIPNPPVIEATGWQTAPNGEVLLVAHSTTPTGQPSLNRLITCRAEQ